MLTKKEVAKRHFIEAEILFFEKRDPIAIHHLIHAAHEILSKITKKNILLNDLYLTELGKKFAKPAFVKAKNFIKHADKDRDESFFFNPNINVILLLDCAYMLYDVYGDDFFPGKTYILWCAATEPALFKDSFLIEVDKAKQVGFDPNDSNTIVTSLKYWVQIKKNEELQ